MLSFRVSGLPPSYNKIFNINYSLRECYLSPEARAFKNKVKLVVPDVVVDKDRLYKVHIEYHGNFHYKNGSNKRIDLQNLHKLLIDATFEKLGVDDSRVWILYEKKIHSETEEYTQVTVEVIDEFVQSV